MPPCQPTWQTSIEHLTHTCAPNMGQIMVKAQLCDTDHSALNAKRPPLLGTRPPKNGLFTLKLANGQNKTFWLVSTCLQEECSCLSSVLINNNYPLLKNQDAMEYMQLTQYLASLILSAFRRFFWSLQHSGLLL